VDIRTRILSRMITILELWPECFWLHIPNEQCHTTA
jgi:hypothetical protein